MSRGPRVSIALASLSFVGGCLSVPDVVTPECTTTADCDRANGEVCEEGVCWGNPPTGMFAAVISPPSDRKDLVPKELTQVVITQSGWLNDLQLEVPVTLSGRIEAICQAPIVCDRSSLGATITVTRPSQFHGGPGFKAVVSSESKVDGPSFEIALPRTNPNDAHYTLTIVPDGRGPEPAMGGPTPAELVPPLRVDLPVPTSLAGKTITLGGTDLPVIDGVVTSELGAGLALYRVVALGHWESGTAPTEVSTIDYTGADGKFHLVLSKDLVGPVELVAKPYGSATAPDLHLVVTGVPATGTISRALVQPAGVGVMLSVPLQIKGKIDGGGSISPVRGARVRVTGVVPSPQIGGASATLVAEATTDDNGSVTLDLLDGVMIKDSYKLEVVPPASASVGVVFDHPLSLLAPQPPIMLPSRIAIRGIALDIHGDPLKDVSVTARPSLRFLWSLDDAPQAFASAVPAATAVTPATGEFVLWIDPNLADVWGYYDLVFEPSVTSRAATWVDQEIEIPRGSPMNVTIPDLRLPDAAFVHGLVSDAFGTPVEASEVKLFRVNTSLALCSEVIHAPVTCPIPATLQGRGASDAVGLVRLTLPR